MGEKCVIYILWAQLLCCNVSLHTLLEVGDVCWFWSVDKKKIIFVNFAADTDSKIIRLFISLKNASLLFSRHMVTFIGVLLQSYAWVQAIDSKRNGHSDPIGTQWRQVKSIFSD
ncbi:MAG: hypothetical protein ACRCZO_17615, partial [Cetobacterium sp.]